MFWGSGDSSLSIRIFFFKFFFWLSPSHLLNIYLFIFILWPHCVASGILVPWPGIELESPALEAWSLNHWTTREAPNIRIVRGYNLVRNSRRTVTLQLESRQHSPQGHSILSDGLCPGAGGRASDRVRPVQHGACHSEEQTAEGLVKRWPKSRIENLLFPYICTLILEGDTELTVG